MRKGEREDATELQTFNVYRMNVERGALTPLPSISQRSDTVLKGPKGAADPRRRRRRIFVETKSKPKAP
jgi:hypothetical protein